MIYFKHFQSEVFQSFLIFLEHSIITLLTDSTQPSSPVCLTLGSETDTDQTAVHRHGGKPSISQHARSPPASGAGIRTELHTGSPISRSLNQLTNTPGWSVTIVTYFFMFLLELPLVKIKSQSSSFSVDICQERGGFSHALMCCDVKVTWKSCPTFIFLCKSPPPLAMGWSMINEIPSLNKYCSFQVVIPD